MKQFLLMIAAGGALLLGGCTGAGTGDGADDAATEAAAMLTAATVERVKVDVPCALPAGCDGLQRDVLDKLVPVAKDGPLAAADSVCSNAADIVAVIEHVADGLPEVPHVTRYRQRVATVKVPLAGADSVSAEMLVDLDWPDATVDPGRHIRHCLNDLVFEALNGQFPQPKDKDATAVKQYLQALDDPAEMMRHYAGRYSRAYQSLIEAGEAQTPNFAQRVSLLARPNVIARVRALSDDWVTYYLAVVDCQGRPSYGFVTLNRLTGVPMQAADIVGKERVAALDAAVVAALDAAAARQGVAADKLPYALAVTPEGLVASRAGVVVFM
ncbi:MAG: hypothetical protein IJU62_01300 [Muribaculaceae bacterium]|nr:hypothetical protein [Muribaculaceae bacterium]